MDGFGLVTRFGGTFEFGSGSGGRRSDECCCGCSSKWVSECSGQEKITFDSIRKKEMRDVLMDESRGRLRTRRVESSRR